MTRIDVRDRALVLATREIGVHEEGGQNVGPRVEEYLRAADLPPGQPWCAAFVLWCYAAAQLYLAAQERLGVQPPLLPRTGSCARLWARTTPLWRSDRPSVGSIFIHLSDRSNPESKGHCGIVTAIGALSITAIEGNTNSLGSRNGDCVRQNHRQRVYVNAGYIDVGRVGPTEAPGSIVG